MTAPVFDISATVATQATVSANRDSRLQDAARELEASFLAEMLKHAGFGAPRATFGGGAGEDQFASLLRVEHARVLAENGGIGLAQGLFDALVRRENARSEDVSE